MKLSLKKTLAPLTIALAAYLVAPEKTAAQGNVEFATYAGHSTLEHTIRHPVVGDFNAFHKGKVTFTDGQGRYFGFTDISHQSGIDNVALIGEIQYSGQKVSFRPGLGASPLKGCYIQGTTGGNDLEVFLSATKRLPIDYEGKREAILTLRSLNHKGENEFHDHQVRLGIGYDAKEVGLALSKRQGKSPSIGVYGSVKF